MPRNPILRLNDNLRDPAIMRSGAKYRLFFTLYRPGEWGEPRNWRVGSCTTADFRSFSPVEEITPHRHASPYDPIQWGGRWIMAFQSYPGRPSELHFAESADGAAWSPPIRFLPEVTELPWNLGRRAIDPSLAIEDGRLYCFFVGNASDPHNPRAVNALGLAVTEDPELKSWEILTPEAPLFQPHKRGHDGIENLALLPATDAGWWMYLSEGIEDQHVVRYHAERLAGPWIRDRELHFPDAAWMAHRHGAPCVWRDGGTLYLLLMGEEDAAHRSSLGLFTSTNGLDWESVD